MKKTLMLSALVLLTLAGCGNAATTDTNTWSVANTGAAMTAEANTGKTTPTEFRFGIDTCDQYTKLMECVIDKIPTSGKADTVAQYENVIKMWKWFSGSDLKAICDQTMSALNDTSWSFAKIGCNL